MDKRLGVRIPVNEDFLTLASCWRRHFATIPAQTSSLAWANGVLSHCYWKNSQWLLSWDWLRNNNLVANLRMVFKEFAYHRLFSHALWNGAGKLKTISAVVTIKWIFNLSQCAISRVDMCVKCCDQMPLECIKIIVDKMQNFKTTRRRFSVFFKYLCTTGR